MLSIITISHGHEKFFSKYWDSIKEFIRVPFEIIYVDNINGGAFFEKHISGDSRVRVIKNSKSKSFSANNNFALKIAKYEKILFLNPDTWFCDDSVSKWLMSETRISGLVYPVLFNEDGTRQDHCRPKPNIFDQMSRFVKIKSKTNLIHDGEEYWYFGAAILADRTEFLNIGGFDEMFPLYGEDAEICDRYRKMRYSVCKNNDIFVYHHLHDASKHSLKFFWKLLYSGFVLRYAMMRNSVRGFINERGLPPNLKTK